MDSLFLTTVAGLAGASIGSITSASTTWLAQRAQLRDSLREAARRRREEVFRDFIIEASRLFGDALSHEKDDVSDLVQLYALVARMRLFASAEVVESADKAMNTIIEAYLAPNRTLHELRDLAKAGGVDFLLDFGEACRSELSQVMAGRLNRPGRLARRRVSAETESSLAVAANEGRRPTSRHSIRPK